MNRLTSLNILFISLDNNNDVCRQIGDEHFPHTHKKKTQIMKNRKTKRKTKRSLSYYNLMMHPFFCCCCFYVDFWSIDYQSIILLVSIIHTLSLSISLSLLSLLIKHYLSSSSSSFWTFGRIQMMIIIIIISSFVYWID